MEITWYGLSCFRLVERGTASVVTDPYDHRQTGYAPLKLSADIVTISHEAPGHSYLEAVHGTPYLIRGPGEYEVGGVFITGIHTSGSKDVEQNRNTLYVYDFDTITVAHLGDLNRVPNQSEVEAFGNVNVALVPVGGGNSLNPARAAEVISILEPNIVIPMHYATAKSKVALETIGKFLKEMGVNDVHNQTTLRVTKTTLPEETQVVVLDEQCE